MVKHTTVKHMRMTITLKPSIIHEDASLFDVAKKMIEDPKTRAVYVVDSQRRLKGIIPVQTLVEYIFQDYIPKYHIRLFDICHMFEVMGAENAADIMLEPVSVVINLNATG